jgi:nucleoside-diphosphate-sugar epimerase
MENKILITGVTSGLGKYFDEKLRGIPLTRNTTKLEWDKLNEFGVDVIIHCAFNSSKNINSDNLGAYLEDNLELTRRLLNIPHKKFIFISTIDVYPKDGNEHIESESISLDKISDIYALSKLMCEALIKNKSPNYLILRCSSLLGPYMKKNNLIKILDDDNPILSLDSKSEFIYVLYSDLLDFIRKAIDENLAGTYNAVSSETIKLESITSLLNKKVTFGSYLYLATKINNNKICEIFPEFKASSLDKLKRFISERKNA